MDEQTQALIQLIGAFLLGGGGVLGFIRYIGSDKKKTNAEVDKLVADRENSLALTVANLGVEIARLTTSLDEERQKRRALEDEFESMKDEHQMLKQVNVSLRKGVKILSKQLTANDIKPEYTLPD